MSDSALAPSICQICGEPLGVQVIRCPACDTPHHVDCWDYAGCSTYGCAQRRAAPTAGRPPSVQVGRSPSGSVGWSPQPSFLRSVVAHFAAHPTGTVCAGFAMGMILAGLAMLRWAQDALNKWAYGMDTLAYVEANRLRTFAGGLALLGCLLLAAAAGLLVDRRRR